MDMQRRYTGLDEALSLPAMAIARARRRRGLHLLLA